MNLKQQLKKTEEEIKDKIDKCNKLEIQQDLFDK